LHRWELPLLLAGLQAYFLDLRQQLRRTDAQRLGSRRALAALVGVRQSFVEKRRRRRTGGSVPRPHAGSRRALCNEAALAVVRSCVPAHPEAPLAAVGERRLAQRGLHVSVPSRGRLVIALRWLRKKRRSTPTHRRWVPFLSRTPAGGFTIVAMPDRNSRTALGS
jgi:transposase